MTFNYPSGRALPANGAVGALLTKASTVDQQATWTNILSTGTGAPAASFVSPLYFDTTASTGGLYAWNGAAYTKVALATT